jgi:hypothetical protein
LGKSDKDKKLIMPGREETEMEQPGRKEPFHKYISEYRKHVAKGAVKKAYQGLMGYFEDLRLHLEKKYPDYFLSGSVRQGQMDYTYFYFFPKTLKQRGLKIVILFIHDSFTFEVWLAGYNKNVQAEYLKLFREYGWNKHHLASSTKGVDYIADSVLVGNPDFSDLEALTGQLESGTLKFIKDIEDFLSEHKT